MRIGYDMLYQRRITPTTMWVRIRQEPNKVWLIAGLALSFGAFVGVGMTAGMWMPALARHLQG